ncbi:hypothetical protein KY314_00210 [Candidatus Woesearchaeota archaeon]|nr:hypothetical protein [Candidatus Woesearchaeota archaeon]
MKKRSVILLSILVLIIVTGCGSKEVYNGLPQQDVAPLTSEETKAFVHSLPNIRDAVDSTFGSWNIFINSFIVDFDAKKTMISPSASIVSGIQEKANTLKQTMDNIDLILADFGRKKSGVDLSDISSSDEVLVQDIDSKLSNYALNKDKFDLCINNIKNYAEFVDLTVEREKLISDFTRNMNSAGVKVDDNKIDEAINLGSSAKSNLLRIKQIDLDRSKIGVVDVNSDILMSWDLHLEAMDILLSLWNDLKRDDMNSAMEKAQQHYNTFERANKYGEKELPVAQQAELANAWINNNIGVCLDLV